MHGASSLSRWLGGLCAPSMAVLLLSCGGDGNLTGEPVPNAAPETSVTATPPILSQTAFTVSFFWTGSDRDGRVEGFEWRISDNGRDGIIDIQDTLQAWLPWHSTESTDSTFIVSADLDSFAVDVADTNQNDATFRFWQTHTFFIRSVDDEGARDPTPASVSFTATTLAPTIAIDLPKFIPFNTCSSASRVLTFGWSGEDPDNVVKEPQAVRYLLLPIGSLTDPCLTQDEFNRISPIHADDPRWSDWRAYDAPQDSGRIVSLARQEVGDSFIFAVQARDVAGAVTPTFTWGRNVRHVRIGTDKFPALLVTERFLGNERFVSTNGFKRFEIVSGQPLEFEYICDGSDYAGIIEAYRYGWNLVDPDDPNDPGWSVAWGNGPSWRRPAPRSFTQGAPNLVVQCRDNSGTISRAFYQFEVIQIAERRSQRNLLLIDDSGQEDTPQTRALDDLWDRQWAEMLVGKVPGFQASDVLDTQEEPQRLGFRLVNKYKSVIWFTDVSARSYFHTRIAPESVSEPRYNWLEIYQARVGNLLFTGPGAMFNSLARRSDAALLFPIVFNVPVSGRFGFGTEQLADGSILNVGTTRWPYSSWCLDAIDLTRPPLGGIFGESPGNILRSAECEGLARAAVDSFFFDAFPDAQGQVVDLLPTPERLSMDPLYKLTFEEFYNRNTTNREVRLVLRDCQVPMFLYRARRDEGLVSDPEATCPSGGSGQSPLTGAPIGIASRRYTETKQLRGSADFLWGFHPLAFDLGGVSSALYWILESRWELPVQGR